MMSSPRRSLALLLLLSACAHHDKGASDKPRLPPAKPEALEAFKDGARMVRLGAAHYDRAVERLEAAVAADPRLWEAHYDLGWLALQSKSYESAARSFEKALEIYPRHFGSVLGVGKAYEETGRADSAVSVYKKFLDGKPKAEEAAPVRIALGNALRRAGKLDAALETLRDALRAEPRNAPALAGLGLVYEAKGNHELAELVLRRSLDIEGKGKAAADVWNNLGLIALSRRRDQEAFADFAEAAKLDPTLTAARRNRAIVYLDCGDYDKAAGDLRELVKTDPGDAAAWVALGVAERGRGQHDAAERAYKKALEIETEASQQNALDARYNLGVLYMDFKKSPDKAREALSDFVKAAPGKHPKVKDAEQRLKDLAPKDAGGSQSSATSSTQAEPGKPGAGSHK
jgi:tetratricopeptide (TPR) repeat protein